MCATDPYQAESEHRFRAQRDYSAYQAVGTGHPRVKGHIFKPGVVDDGLLVHIVIDEGGTQDRSEQPDRDDEPFPSRSRQLVVSNSLMIGNNRISRRLPLLAP